LTTPRTEEEPLCAKATLDIASTANSTAKCASPFLKDGLTFFIDSSNGKCFRVSETFNFWKADRY